MADEKSATESLADQLLVGALEGVKECKRIGYNPSAFLAMLHERCGAHSSIWCVHPSSSAVMVSLDVGVEAARPGRGVHGRVRRAIRAAVQR